MLIHAKAHMATDMAFLALPDRGRKNPQEIHHLLVIAELHGVQAGMTRILGVEDRLDYLLGPAPIAAPYGVFGLLALVQFAVEMGLSLA
jgi:hypothetical protein